MAESFAHLLKRHRVAAGLSQESLAERARLSVDAISYLERDPRHAPQKATLDLLIAALALDDSSRRQLEEAAKLSRARGPQPQPHGIFPESPNEFPPNNLPPQLTSFVDREKDVAEIEGLLQSHRLVTLVGSGGVGKSRCAVQIGAQMREIFKDGVWLAELAAISDPVLVSTVIARSLSLQEMPNRPLLDTLFAYLKRKHVLLILDNCEHVIDEARRVVAAILHDCPDVRILTTSRESLSIAGEHVYRLPSLPVPSTSQLLSAEKMLQYGAVQLFTDRAGSANISFTLSVESAAHVADVCRRLDGIPLAIELAAARIKVLSPRELAQRLDERFRLLTGGDRSALPRHRTMRALIDWSYDLLSDDERRLFRKLSIFAGGCTLQTAADVCSDGALDEIAVLDLLSSLVEKSLVEAEFGEGNTRYRLLESTRQYAREKLRDAGQEDTAARAHALAFLRLAEQLNDVWEITPDRVWDAQAEPELENFRAALSWSFGARGEELLGQRLAAVLYRVWYAFGPVEGRRWVQAAQQRVSADTPDSVLAALDLAESRLVWTFAQTKASIALAERALARYRELADRRGIAEAARTAGHGQIILGRISEGETLAGQAFETARALGAHKTVIGAMSALASARLRAGDLPGARQGRGEALAIARTVGAERFAANIALGLAELEFQCGDAGSALRLVDEALPLLHAFGETNDVAMARCNMAAYLVALRRYDEARTAARQAVTAAREAQHSVGLAFTLQHMAATAALRPSADAPAIEDRSRAARILGYVAARLVALEVLRDYTEQQEYDAMNAALCDALGEDELAKLMAEGSTWSEDRAVAEAMLIEPWPRASPSC